MNYDRRFSPGDNPDYSTRTINPHRDTRSQQITPRGGIESRAQAYGREYPPLRSRSQTNVEQDYGDRFSHPPQFYDNRLDLKSRSKSLDNREFRNGDDGFYRNDYPGDGGVVIPIRREIGRGPQYDYRSSPQSRPREVEAYGFDERRPPAGQEVHIPYNNRESREQHVRDGRDGRGDGRDARDQYIREDRDGRDLRDAREPRDFGTLGPIGPRRSFDGRIAMGDSPKSHSSRYKDSRRAVEYNQERGRFGDEFEREDYGALQPYRGPPGHIGGVSGGTTGGYRSSSHHRSHHESYGGGHESSFGAGASRAITQQPQMFHPDARPVRPIQHHRVQCCCFKFVWPPWSYEQAPPPQPIYRNI